MANDIFRVGKVSSIDYAAGLVRVAYHDKDDSVTAPLPMLCTEYNMPQVGDPVMVLHLSNGTEAGLVLGRYWSNNNKPPEGAAGLFRKDLDRTPGESHDPVRRKHTNHQMCRSHQHRGGRCRNHQRGHH